MRLPHFLVLVLLLLVKPVSQAMFVRHETEQVPIARIFTNLQQRLATNAGSYDLHYQLARLYAMASTTNLSAMPVVKGEGDVAFGYPGSDNGTPDEMVGWLAVTNAPVRTNDLRHLTNALAHYEVAIKLMKKSTNVNEVRWLILPTQLGYAWCLEKAGRREDALDSYRKTLSIAWQEEVTGEFKVEEWLKGIWSDVKSLKNPVHSQGRGHLGPGTCYSEESITYLIKLLDPRKDAGEIADLKEKQKKLSSWAGRSRRF